MQNVSEGWKLAQEQELIGENFVDLSFYVVDPIAQEAASASDNGHLFLSNTDQIFKLQPDAAPKYATLEKNLWRADGSLLIAGDTDNGLCGFISGVLSNPDSTFTVAPTITLAFTEVMTQAVPGIKITWSATYGDYAADYTIQVYNGDAIVTSKVVTNNAEVNRYVEMEFNNYSKIVISIQKWSAPQHYARVERILIGDALSLTKSDLMTYKHSMRSSPIDAELPSVEVSFALDNSNETFSPGNDTGWSRYLSSRQRVYIRYGQKLETGSVEYIPAASVYLTDWSAPQNGLTANFVAKDLFSFMQNNFIKGVYTTSGETLYNLAEQVLIDAKLPEVGAGENPWVLDAALKGITTTAPLPLATHAVCLQYIAQMANCVLEYNRDGKILIAPAPTGVTDYEVPEMFMYQRPETTLQTPIKAVSVDTNVYFPAAEFSELFNGSVEVHGAETVIIKYSSPAADVAATSSALQSAKYYTNACELTLTGNGAVTVVIKGKTLNTTTTPVLVGDSSALESEIQRVSNPLINNATQAKAVGAWVLTELTERRIASLSDWRADPRLDPVDTIKVANKFGTTNVRMSEVAYSVTGAIHGSGKGRVSS